MSPDPAAHRPTTGQPAPRPDPDAAQASQPPAAQPVAGDRVRATYPNGRTVDGIFSPTGNGLAGFRLHTDDGHLHIHAAGPVHCHLV